MGILEDRADKILKASNNYLNIDLPINKPTKLVEGSNSIEKDPSIPNPNDYSRKDAFSFVYKEGKLYIDEGQIKLAPNVYKYPAGKGLNDKSVVSVWFSYDDIFEEPFSKAIFALKSNGFINESTRIKFYDSSASNEYTSVKAFVKDYYKQGEKLRLFPKQIKLGRFDEE